MRPIRSHKALWLLFVVSLLVSACNVSPTATALPPGTAVPTQIVTTEPPTAEPTAEATPVPTQPAAVSGTQFSKFGVTFNYDPSLATGIDAALVPAVTGGELPFFMIASQHAAFTFTGYLVQTYGPQIQVFSPEAYVNQSSSAQVLKDRLAEIQANLAQRPDLNQKYKLFIEMGGNGAPGGVPPVIPAINAQIVVAAKKGYIDFGNGSGMRFVYWASQAVMPVDPNFLFYTFEGLTADGKHFVTVTFPVHVAVTVALPTPPFDATPADMDRYNEAVAQAIEAADPGAFTPSLALLDAVALSLQIAPEAP